MQNENNNQQAFIVTPPFEKICKLLGGVCIIIGVARLVSDGDYSGFFAELLYAAAAERFSKTFSSAPNANKRTYLLQCAGLFTLGLHIDSEPFINLAQLPSSDSTDNSPSH